MFPKCSRRRGGVTLFRRRIPLDLISRIGATEIVRSLGRCSPGEERRLTGQLWNATESLFMITRAQPLLSRRELQAIAGRLLDPWTDKAEGLLERTAESGSAPAEVIERQSAKFKGIAAVARTFEHSPAMLSRMLGDEAQGVAPENLQRVAAYVADELARRSSLLSQQTSSLAPSAVPDEGQAITVREYEIEPSHTGLSSTQVAKILSRVKDGEKLSDYLPPDALTEHKLQQPAIGEIRDHVPPRHQQDNIVPPAQPAVQVKVPVGESAALIGDDATIDQRLKWAGLPLSQVWMKYEALRMAPNGGWKNYTKGHSKPAIDLFIAHCGDRAVQDYTSGNALSFRTFLRELPAGYDKGKWLEILNRDGIKEVHAQANADGPLPASERLKEKTVQKHLTVLRGIWKMAPSCGAIPDSSVTIFKGLFLKEVTPGRYSRVDREDRSRDKPTDDEARRIFVQPIFTGCRSARDWVTPGHVVPLDERYWGCLIGHTTGMRREEFLQLDVRHVAQEPESGIYYFNLMNISSLNLKDVGSPRWVPVPASLIELGFLDQRVHGRSKTDLLFPEAPGLNSRNCHGDAFGKWYSSFKTGLGMPSQVVFNSWRHWVCTKLIEVGVPREIAEEITGHESVERRIAFDGPGGFGSGNSAFANYEKAKVLTVLKDAIDRLPVMFDIEALKTASQKYGRADFSPRMKARRPDYSGKNKR